MTGNRYVKWGLLGLFLALRVAPTLASDPVGIYGVIDRVVLTPNDKSPTTAEIWGTFAVAVTPPTSTYTPSEAYGAVQKGYLLYTCPAGKASTCANEWSDLKALAGKNEVAGFGVRWGTTTHVRKAGEPAMAPDIYPINVGVVKMGKYGAYPDIAAALTAASGRK